MDYPEGIYVAGQKDGNSPVDISESVGRGSNRPDGIDPGATTQEEYLRMARGEKPIPRSQGNVVANAENTQDMLHTMAEEIDALKEAMGLVVEELKRKNDDLSSYVVTFQLEGFGEVKTSACFVVSKPGFLVVGYDHEAGNIRYLPKVSSENTITLSWSSPTEAPSPSSQVLYLGFNWQVADVDYYLFPKKPEDVEMEKNGAINSKTPRWEGQTEKDAAVGGAGYPSNSEEADAFEGHKQANDVASEAVFNKLKAN